MNDNDDFGDETEYLIIIAKGEQEAVDFGTEDGIWFHPAKWLNPPTRVEHAE